EVRAMEVLDAEELVARGGSAGASARQQADLDAGIAVAVVRSIAAGAPMQFVRAAATLDDVVAPQGVNLVDAALADDHVLTFGYAIIGIDGLAAVGSVDGSHGNLLFRSNRNQAWGPLVVAVSGITRGLVRRGTPTRRRIRPMCDRHHMSRC